MYKIHKLPNGLTVITVPQNRVKSVTTLLAVGAGTRYENDKNNGISHFLEHMAFKGTKKYPSAEIISTLVDGMGAINNAYTDKETTVFWLKSEDKDVNTSSDILSSMIKESLFDHEEIEKEKGVIIEEMKMYLDDPARHIWRLYLNLQFGETPLGMDTLGTEQTIKQTSRQDFLDYMESLYSPSNMVLVYVGKLPKDILKLAAKYFGGLKNQPTIPFLPFKPINQTKPKVNIYEKSTDQAKLILGMESYSRSDERKYALRVLSTILGGGMSSRLFLQVRERRGLAYYVGCAADPLIDTGYLAIYAGLRLTDLEQGLKVILEEVKKISTELVTTEELKKAKEMSRGRLAIAMESTNFLAENFGVEYLLDKKFETFEEYLQKIEAVTKEQVLEVAKDIFNKNKFNLQLIAPLKDTKPFEQILEEF